MRLVIDASVAIEVALSGGRLENLAGHDLVAPTLLRSEATSILAELAWRRTIPRAQARAALDHLLAIPVRQIDPDDHHAHAWELAESLGWAKTYDAEYVALAIHEAAPLVTLDGRLQRGAGRVATIIAPRDVGSPT